MFDKPVNLQEAYGTDKVKPKKYRGLTNKLYAPKTQRVKNFIGPKKNRGSSKKVKS